LQEVYQPLKYAILTHMKRMLVITPDPESAEILRHALSSSVALDHFKAHDPHIVILDVLGTKTSELEIAEEFVAQMQDDARPTFVLTPRVPDWKAFPILHANHVLKKPYNLTTLIHMVTTVAEATE
jgi:DNA-binding response OmpR family regulator